MNELSEIEGLEQLRDIHVAALNDGDADAWAACFTADAVQMPPNMPANVGIDGIREWSRGFLGAFSAEFSLDPAEAVQVGPDWVIERGAYEIALTPNGGGGGAARPRQVHHRVSARGEALEDGSGYLEQRRPASIADLIPGGGADLGWRPPLAPVFAEGASSWYQLGTRRIARYVLCGQIRGRIGRGGRAGRKWHPRPPAGGRAVAGSNPVSPIALARSHTSPRPSRLGGSGMHGGASCRYAVNWRGYRGRPNPDNDGRLCELAAHSPQMGMHELCRVRHERRATQDCQRPSVSPQRRPSDLPADGHVFSPPVATVSPRLSPSVAAA